MMEDMVRAVEVNDIHPVVDEKVFTLEQAKEAYEYMVGPPMVAKFWRLVLTDCLMQWAQKHFGKLTIKIN